MTQPQPPEPTATTDSGQESLAQIIAYIRQELNSKEDNPESQLTKGQALARTMVNNASTGDSRNITPLFKLIAETADVIAEKIPEDELQTRKEEWESLFAFYGKYKPLIEQEIERLKLDNPGYWNFEWFRPNLENCPWHQAIYGEET